jgi:hypothetical protein
MQLIRCTEDVMRRSPYITISGPAFNADMTEGVFDCNAAQYTTFYKDRRQLSTLPIRAHFDNIRYKTKRPVPSNNTYVVIEGFLESVDFDLTDGHPSLFHIGTENISFLGKAVLPNPPRTHQGIFNTPTKLNSLLMVSQFPLLHRAHLDFNTTSTSLHLLHHNLVSQLL